MQRLKRELGLIDIFCIAMGAMISSGLFVLPSIAYLETGPSVVVSYFIAGLMMLPAILSKVELVTAMPRAGGNYFFIERSLGTFAGIMGGIADWFSLALKSAFALVGIGAFATLLLPGMAEWQIKLIAVAFCIIFMIVNLLSVKGTSKLQLGLVFSLLVLLILFIVLGTRRVELTHFVPFVPFGWPKVFATAGLVFISYGGLTKIVGVAEEVRDPARTLARGLFLAFAIATPLYVLVVFVTVGVLTPAFMARTLTPVSHAAAVFMGRWGELLLSIAAIFAFFTTANAGILAASRTPMAMSRDELLPDTLRRVHKRFGTPYIAILSTGIFMLIVIAFLHIEELAEVASTFILFLFTLINLSVILMRASKLRNYQPKFRSPFYPWLQVGGIFMYTFMIFEMGRLALFALVGLILISLVWYLTYTRGKVRRETALIHLVARITAREIATRSLEKELREILLERDAIVEDRFDEILKTCPIIELTRPMARDEFLRYISDILSKRLNIDADIIYERFVQRESQSSTVIHPGLAIPHIIIDGEKKFDLIIVRAKPGIDFDGSTVHTVFVLVGTLDERNFYLRALMGIAQIVKHPEFENEWLSARDTEDLRNIALVMRRR